MLRIRAQRLKGDIPLGYYCPVCLAIRNISEEYLIPVSVIACHDQYFGTVPPYDVYRAILKTLKIKDISSGVPQNRNAIDQVRDRLSFAIKPYCRPLTTIEKDMKKDLEELTAQAPRSQARE